MTTPPGKIAALRELLLAARSDGARSSALSTIAKVLTVLGVIVLAGVFYGAPFWLLVVLCSVLCVVAAVFLFLYIYFAVKSPDHLRSERYSLKRLEIERGLVGDDRAGLFDPAQRVRVDLASLEPPPVAPRLLPSDDEDDDE